MNLDGWVSYRQLQEIMQKVAKDIRSELDIGLEETEVLRREVRSLRRELEAERRIRLVGGKRK